MALAALNHRLDALIEAIPEDKETRINTVPANIINTDRIQTKTYNLDSKAKVEGLSHAVGSVKDICNRMFGSIFMGTNTRSGVGELSIHMPFFKQTDGIPYIKTWAFEDKADRIWKMGELPPADWIDRLTNIKTYTYESINATLDEAADTITISLEDDAREFVFTRHNATNASSQQASGAIVSRSD